MEAVLVIFAFVVDGTPQYIRAPTIRTTISR
jgi:hypothetical protein